MLHVRVGLVLVASCILLGCGDDSSGGDKKAGSGGSGGKGGTGGSGVMLRDGGTSTGTGGTGGTSAVGTAKEGTECSSANPCAQDLTCMPAALPDGMGGRTSLRICARACADAAADCNTGEVCSSFSGDPKDLLCIKLVEKQFEECGPGFTAGCDRAKGLACAYLGDDPSTLERELLAVCIKPCQTEPSSDDGGVAPTGADVGCDDKQVCLENEPGAGGICSTPAKRGETCDNLGSVFCEAEADICVPDDVNKFDTSPWHCHQNCTDQKTTCDTGECMRLTNGTDTVAWCI